MLSILHEYLSPARQKAMRLSRSNRTVLKCHYKDGPLVDQVFQQGANSFQSNVQALVTVDGKRLVAHYRYYGTRDVENGEPLHNFCLYKIEPHEVVFNEGEIETEDKLRDWRKTSTVFLEVVVKLLAETLPANLPRAALHSRVDGINSVLNTMYDLGFRPGEIADRTPSGLMKTLINIKNLIQKHPNY